MRKTITWEALPLTAKLCLQAAISGNGLLKTEHGYIGRSDIRSTGPRFSAVVVAVLMREGLATSDAFDGRLVAVTDAALVLLHFGTATVEVAA